MISIYSEESSNALESNIENVLKYINGAFIKDNSIHVGNGTYY